MEVNDLEWLSQNEQKIFELSPNKIKPFTCFGLRLRKVSGKNFIAGIQDFKMWEYAGRFAGKVDDDEDDNEMRPCITESWYVH